MSDKASDMLSGAGAMLVFVLILWFVYALGASSGRDQIRAQAVERGLGHYRIQNDSSSEFTWK